MFRRWKKLEEEASRITEIKKKENERKDYIFLYVDKKRKQSGWKIVDIIFILLNYHK